MSIQSFKMAIPILVIGMAIASFIAASSGNAFAAEEYSSGTSGNQMTSATNQTTSATNETTSMSNETTGATNTTK